jgi:plastocyanin
MHTRHDCKRPAWEFFRLLPALLLALPLSARAEQAPLEITITMGDYRYAPDVIEVKHGQSIILHLTNTDSITPHNFTLVDQPAGLNVDTDIGAGTSARIQLTPLQPGSYIWYCNKKLPFMKSHRDRGMQGTLVVR